MNEVGRLVQLEPDQIAMVEPTNTRQRGRVAANTAPYCEHCLSEGLNGFVQEKYLSQTVMQRIIMILMGLTVHTFKSQCSGGRGKWASEFEGRSVLHSKFQASQDYVGRPCLLAGRE